MESCFGYYGSDDLGRCVLYIPGNVIGFEAGDDFCFNYEPQVLSNLLNDENYGSLEDLLKKGWDVKQFEIPKHFIKQIHNLCFRLNSGRDERLESIIDERFREIVNYAGDIIDFETNLPKVKLKEHSEGYTDEDLESYEQMNQDYLDQWFLRGDPPPWE